MKYSYKVEQILITVVTAFLENARKYKLLRSDSTKTILQVSITILSITLLIFYVFSLYISLTYRVDHLAFGISTIGYFEFERRNNIYDVSEI